MSEGSEGVLVSPLDVLLNSAAQNCGNSPRVGNSS